MPRCIHVVVDPNLLIHGSDSKVRSLHTFIWVIPSIDKDKEHDKKAILHDI